MRMFLVAFGCLAAMPAFAETVPIGELRYGTTVQVSGVVEQITDEDEFRITDDSGSVRVYIGPGIVPFDTGETITVSGIVDRDFGRLELYAREAVRADGSRVTFDHRYE
jgi:uncharacterized protein YdeI (BOF family)